MNYKKTEKGSKVVFQILEEIFEICIHCKSEKIEF